MAKITNGRRRALCLRPNWKWPLAAILMGLMLGPAWESAAESPEVSLMNNLEKSRDLVLVADQYCDPLKENRVRLGFWNLKLKQTKSNTGAISQFGVTAHVISTGHIDDARAALLIVYADTRSSNCATYIEFNARGGRITLRTSKRDRSLVDWLSPQQRDHYFREMAACKAAAIPAPRHSKYGNYEILPDGTFVESGFDSEYFSCESAVPNNVSSVDVNTGHGRIRVVTIGETVFLEELPR